MDNNNNNNKDYVSMREAIYLVSAQLIGSNQFSAEDVESKIPLISNCLRGVAIKQGENGFLFVDRNWLDDMIGKDYFIKLALGQTLDSEESKEK